MAVRLRPRKHASSRDGLVLPLHQRLKLLKKGQKLGSLDQEASGASQEQLAEALRDQGDLSPELLQARWGSGWEGMGGDDNMGEGSGWEGMGGDGNMWDGAAGRVGQRMREGRSNVGWSNWKGMTLGMSSSTSSTALCFPCPTTDHLLPIGATRGAAVGSCRWQR